MRFSIIIISVFSFSIVFGQKHVSSPINPKFIEYQKSVKSGDVSDNYGYIPLPVSLKFGKTKKSIKDFPWKYDMRDSNWVTEVKDQKRCGSCWNFTTMAAIESNWKKKGFGEFDLSEQNMRTCQKYNLPGSGTCNAGNELVAAGYLFSNLGPVNEVDDVYDGRADATCVENLSKMAYVPEVVFLPSEAESSLILRGIIKQAIIDHGGVFTSMYMDEDLLQSDSTYYCSVAGQNVNHAVLLVGWNDSVKISNKTGAWIVKNSWGADWGSDGYFLLSYKDRYALSNNAVFPKKLAANYYDTVYMYDEVGWISNSGFSNKSDDDPTNDTVETAYGLVKFTSVGKQKITEVGTYVNTSNTELEFEIFMEKNGHQLDTKVAELKGIVCEYPGHYTFSLDKPIQLSSNTDFYIKVKYFTPGYGYPIPNEKFLAYYSDPILEDSVCWISSSGNYWAGLNSTDEFVLNQIDLTIKAYAVADTLQSSSDSKVIIAPNPAKNIFGVTIEKLDPVEITLELINSRGELVYKDTFNNSSDFFSHYYDVSQLDTGIYYVRIINGSNIETRKVVIVR